MTIFTFGEYGQMEHGVNTCGGLMLSFTAFGKWRAKPQEEAFKRRDSMKNLIGYDWKGL